jgi:hypothetical protein
MRGTASIQTIDQWHEKPQIAQRKTASGIDSIFGRYRREFDADHPRSTLIVRTVANQQDGIAPYPLPSHDLYQALFLRNRRSQRAIHAREQSAAAQHLAQVPVGRCRKHVTTKPAVAECIERIARTAALGRCNDPLGAAGTVRFDEGPRLLGNYLNMRAVPYAPGDIRK